MRINRHAQIARILAAQCLTRDDAANLLATRIYEARRYLDSRRKRPIRYGFGIRFTTGGTVSGHFINDVGATVDDAADWIARYQLNKLPDDYRIASLALWLNGRVILHRDF